MPDSTLRNATDTYTDGANASSNYATSAVLRVRSADRFAWLHFNSPAPLGSTIKRATLRLYYAETWTARTISAQRIAASWKLSRLTHQNRPAVTGAVASAAASAGAAGSFVELDVTAIMQTVANGATWHGLRISSSSSTSSSFVSTEGHSTRRPTLFVEWTDAPQAPTTLHPSAGNAVATAKPTLRFDYTDALGDTTLDAVQVQLDAAADWSSPDFDSGWVTSTSPELDLSSTAYAGLANGAAISWRVRVRDGAGLVSQWSDDESFSRRDLSTVTITNPPSATNAVTEPTPPITWTFTGTQTRYRVIISDANNPSVVVDDSKTIDGIETSWTPRSGALKGVGPYRVDVRVFDEYVREATGDALDYASASRTFTVTTDPTVTAVASLAATQLVVDKPRIELTWSRGTAPDHYVIVRDGVTIEDRLAPEEALVAGTSNSYIDDAARPWVSHTWQVRAVVNGKMSGSASVSATPKTRGIWLFDKSNDLEVWLAGDEAGSWAMGEEASVFAPIGGISVVRRVQSQRGYEGQLGGILVDHGGRTAAQYESDLLAMRAEPSRVVTLALADLAIRVVLGNITTYPTNTVPPVRRVSFDFWEVKQ